MIQQNVQPTTNLHVPIDVITSCWNEERTPYSTSIPFRARGFYGSEHVTLRHKGIFASGILLKHDALFMLELVRGGGPGKERDPEHRGVVVCWEPMVKIKVSKTVLDSYFFKSDDLGIPFGLNRTIEKGIRVCLQNDGRSCTDILVKFDQHKWTLQRNS